MEKNLCFIGESVFLNNLEMIVKHSFERGIDYYWSAESGLEVASQRQYPLILVNDVLPSGDLELPPQISIDDGIGIGMYVIKKIREGSQNKSTPLLVMYTLPFIGYDTRDALKKYAKAGASHCLNWNSFLNPKEVADALRNYLDIHTNNQT